MLTDEHCEIPDIPLATLDELMAMDGSNSSSSSGDKNLRPQNHRTPKISGLDGTKSNSTSISAISSSSLQDLVESFDKNVCTALKDMNKDVEKIAPIKIRSQEEIMSESQFWWTLTGDFGSLPPIDFDRSVIRRKQLAALDLQFPKNKNDENTPTDPSLSDGEVDGEETDRLDFHQAAGTDLHLNENGEAVNADRVIEEIDEILQAGDFMHQSLATQRSTLESFDSMYSSMRSPNVCPDAEPEFEGFKPQDTVAISMEEMGKYSQSKLLTIVSEMEQIIQLYNQELVRELARRDEFEYEKEVRNKFITLLIAVQEQRRKAGSGKKQKQPQGDGNGQTAANNNLASVTIPYDDSQEVPDVQTLEPLVKILQAMVDDSQQLPNLLTDYILNVICPSKSGGIGQN